MQESRKNLLFDASAVGALILFWMFLCHRLFANFSTHFFISPYDVDAVGHFWLSWWASKAVYSPDLSLFFCPYLNYPIGAETFTYHVAYIHIFLAGLFRPILGAAAAINLMYVWGVLLNLMGMYALVRQVSNSRIFCAAIAIIPTIYASALVEVIDVEQVNLGYMMIALALWLAAMKSRNKLLLVACGIMVGVTCITQMYYGISLSVLIALAIAADKFGIGPFEQSAGPIVRKTVIAYALAGAIVLPVMLPTIKTLSKISMYQSLAFLPENEESLELFMGPWNLVPILILGAMIWFAAKRDRVLWFWFIATCSFLFLAIGPYIAIGEQRIPMPFWLLRQTIPLFWRLSMPVRFGRIAVICLVIFFAIYHKRVIQRLTFAREIRPIVFVGLFYLATLIAPLLVDGTPSLLPQIRPVTAHEVRHPPEVFKSIGLLDDQSPIFDLHCEQDAEMGAYYQVFHEKPINGLPLVAQNLRKIFEYSEMTWLREAFCKAENASEVPPIPDAAWWEKRGVRFLALSTIYAERMGPEFLEQWENRVGLTRHKYQFVYVYDLKKNEPLPPAEEPFVPPLIEEEIPGLIPLSDPEE